MCWPVQIPFSRPVCPPLSSCTCSLIMAHNWPLLQKTALGLKGTYLSPHPGQRLLSDTQSQYLSDGIHIPELPWGQVEVRSHHYLVPGPARSCVPPHLSPDVDLTPCPRLCMWGIQPETYCYAREKNAKEYVYYAAHTWQTKESEDMFKSQDSVCPESCDQRRYTGLPVPATFSFLTCPVSA